MKQKKKVFKVIEPRKCENCIHYGEKGKKVVVPTIGKNYNTCDKIEEKGNDEFKFSKIIVYGFFFVAKNFYCRHWKIRE
jgi:hypothetical protein